MADPEGRDRGVDALRALAILGVVGGHWLVTAWERGPGGTVHITSPLVHLPALTPLSWVFQTLAVFFFLGGFAAARSLRSTAAEGQASWVRTRLGRLSSPLGAPALVWAGIAVGTALHGMPAWTIRALLLPAIGPLWFLAVFAALNAATPLLLRARPCVVAASAFAVVLVVDAFRFWQAGPEWLKWVNLVAGWLVPYALGVGWARGALASRGAAAALLAGGAAGAAVLVTGFGYPASMVGVTGARVSNLGPPTLAAVCFGLAQVGLALLAREPLARLVRRPRLWATVAAVNLGAMAVFLWHQTALTLTVLTVLRFDDVPGLLGTPGGAAWPVYRLLWLPVFALVLALLLAAASGPALLARLAGRRLNDRVSS
ncbi:acyltransferase family protein [Streptosporangium carneum]|uniref:Acyltransferase n=1 Tax=Streptosporangium carneum TaxID=47481 RepID=A0A9W6I0N4_9ACTN|nr:acyltransferase [Streptosporangium carneum]GLK08810.1 acyltransferase [Streptosporangium carneum]